MSAWEANRLIHCFKAFWSPEPIVSLSGRGSGDENVLLRYVRSQAPNTQPYYKAHEREPVTTDHELFL